MPSPGNVGLHARRAPRGPRVEITELRTLGALPQDQSNGLVELSCEWIVMGKSTI